MKVGVGSAQPADDIVVDTKMSDKTCVNCFNFVDYEDGCCGGCCVITTLNRNFDDSCQLFEEGTTYVLSDSDVWEEMKLTQ